MHICKRTEQNLLNIGETEGEALQHSWQEATCTDAKTCSVCKISEGKPNGHNWQEATCTTPKTCSVCKETEGKAPGHNWLEATTEAPKTCSVCEDTEGSKLETDSRFTTAATKELQGIWVCDIIASEEIMELPGFGDIEFEAIMNFGNTGEFFVEISLKNENDFMERLKTYTVNDIYNSFALEGLTPEQCDQAMLDTYGMNVNDYVDASLENFNIGAFF